MDKVPWTLKVGSLGWACDMLGGAELGPWPEGFTAVYPCKNCWWTPSCPCAHLPGDEASRRASLPPEDPEHIAHVAHCRGNAPRTAEELASDLASLRNSSCSKTARKGLMTKKGISKLYFVQDPE
jgi:hypothetical protein